MRIALCLFVLLLLLGCTSNYDYDEQSDFENTSAANSNTEFENHSNPGRMEADRKGCVGEGPMVLNTSIVSLENLEKIIPQGQMQGGHVTPVDHQYYNLKRSSDVFSPADGTVTSISTVQSASDYRIVIHHSCSFYTIYIHVDELAPKLLEAVGTLRMGEHKYPSIPIQAGEIFAKVTNQYQSFDFSVHDESVILSGFISPQLYIMEPWKIHTVDPYNYFSEPVKSELLSKTLRTSIPIAGKIDYDVPGALAGNWFEVNSNGYAGNTEPYWRTHVSVAYDHFDPSIVTISLGDFNGESKQFFVTGNLPDPKDVTVSKGLVKYELVERVYTSNGEIWNRHDFVPQLQGFTDNSVKGVVLIQVFEGEKMKLEIFLDEAAPQNFTSNAKLYER
jgi:hypothetical protein